MKLARLIVAFIALAATGGAFAQDKVSLRLNWYLGGLHVPFYYGKDKGYYAAEGIDLTINEGRGSANTVQVVAAGSDTFGLADSSSVVLTASKGADVKSVMSLLNTTGFSVVSLTEAGIKTPKDLEGKKVAVTAGDPLGQLLQAVCKANNVDCAKINMVQVDPAAKVVTVLEKKTDALLGGADDQYFLIKYKGGNPVAMRYADWGANIVGMTIMTSGDTIKKNPDLVKRFVAATIQAYKETEKNPDAAVASMADIVGGSMAEDAGKAQARAVLDVTLGVLYSKANKDKVLGLNVASDWDDMLALMKNYNDLKTDQPATAFYTNDFLP